MNTNYNLKKKTKNYKKIILKFSYAILTNVQWPTLIFAIISNLHNKEQVNINISLNNFSKYIESNHDKSERNTDIYYRNQINLDMYKCQGSFRFFFTLA